MNSFQAAPKPKPGNEWGYFEEQRFNITIERQTLVEFFGVQVLPEVPRSVEDICTTENRAAAADDATYNTLRLMDLAGRRVIGTYMAGDCFIAHLLQKMGFAEGRRLVLMGHEWPFNMAGMKTFALVDVCIVDEKGLPILLVKTEKREYRLPEAYLVMPLVAAAVAAFDKINYSRCRSLLPKFDEITFPAIAVHSGTQPYFYKICISRQFRDVVGSVQMGQATSMTVYCHHPQIEQCYPSLRMTCVDVRREVLRLMEAFRRLIMSGEKVNDRTQKQRRCSPDAFAYVCKETVEHLLLSAGSGEGHHHHHGDEKSTTLGFEFPVYLVFCPPFSPLRFSITTPSPLAAIRSPTPRANPRHPLSLSVFFIRKQKLPPPTDLPARVDRD
ncbi:hypothetical protein PILCRDRAFT_7590 [Piloderma croceum F 1598]|uniref:Uncharacterized protein n=1 Tax=Piloderma croceum (strain F 1598) TaxID=765440 RepID=A0A0C3FSN6_PILCF|nr:hypothetical protein PILCRDRAFT_7590 [Piloderma croceum F 1598]